MKTAFHSPSQATLEVYVRCQNEHLGINAYTIYWLYSNSELYKSNLFYVQNWDFQVLCVRMHNILLEFRVNIYNIR
jgi:hypothetical protein